MKLLEILNTVEDNQECAEKIIDQALDGDGDCCIYVLNHLPPAEVRELLLEAMPASVIRWMRANIR